MGNATDRTAQDTEMNKSIKMIGAITVTAYAGMKAIAYFTRESGSIDEGNSYLAADQGRNSTERKETVYERFVKPNVDSVLSFVGMIALLPVYALTAAAVYLDDPGPVLFSQKRAAKIVVSSDNNFHITEK